MKGNALTGLCGCCLLVLLMFSGCRYVLTKNGLRNIRLGDQFLPANEISWKQGTPRDTSFSESGYTWRGVVLPLDEGYVLVEEDFFNENRINRIRIVSPIYKTRSQVRVGDQVQVLKQLKGPWTLTQIPEYKVLDIYSQTYSSFHFLVEEQGNRPTPDSLDQLDESQKIVGIVIM